MDAGDIEIWKSGKRGECFGENQGFSFVAVNVRFLESVTFYINIIYYYYPWKRASIRGILG